MFGRLVTFLLSATLATVALAQQPSPPAQPDDKDKDKDQMVGQAVPGVVQLRVAGGPAGGMVFRMGNGPMGMGGDALAPLLQTLGNLNLSPEFNLTADQKQKIQAIRDEFKKLSDAWHKDHADELKQLDDQQQEMFQNMQNGGPPDPGMMQDLQQQREQLMETAPNGDDQAKAVKAVLTDDQRKQLEAKQAQEEKEREEMMSHMPMRFGGMRAAQRHEPADHDKDADKDKDKEKEEKEKGR